MASKIKLRRGTKQQWIDAYPIILDIGEPGLELDTDKVKYGDGLTEWQNLTYSSEPIPAQLGNGGKFLTTDGAGVLSWASIVDNDSMYVTSTSLTSTLSNYALTTSLSGYISSTALGHYTFTDDAGDTIRNSSTANINLKTGTRSWSFQTDGTTHFPNYTFPVGHGTAGQVLIDNGGGVLAWGTITGNGNANTGNFTFNSNQLSVNNTNNITLVTNGKTWTFGSNGTTTLPTGGSISLGAGNSTTIIDADGVAIGIDATHYVAVGSPSTVINSNGNSWSFGSTGVLSLPTGGSISRASLGLTAITDADGVAIAVDTSHYVATSTVNTVINSGGNYWTFGTDGILSLPIDSVIKGSSNSTVTIQSNLNNWIFRADGNLRLPDDSTFISRNNTSVNIESNSKTWTFGPDGKLVLPDSGRIKGRNNTSVAIESNSNIWSFNPDGILSLPIDSVVKGSGNSTVTIQSNLHNWIFRTDGNLRLPAGGGITDSAGNSVLGSNTTRLVNGDKTLTLESNGDVTLPSSGNINAPNVSSGHGNSITITAGTTTQMANTGGSIILQAGSGSVPTTGFDGDIQLKTSSDTWTFDQGGKLNLPQSATIADTGNSVVITPNHLASDFQLEIKAYNESPTPDDIHIRANNTDYGLTLGDSNGGSYVSINGDLHDNEVIISTINKNNEERKEFVFDVSGHLQVPGDVQVSSIGAFKNSNGIRAAYINELPTDVSDLTDNSGMFSVGQQVAELNIDGGHALAFFAPPIAADGGGSAGRFGPNSIVFNGGAAAGGVYDTVLNGGGA